MFNYQVSARVDSIERTRKGYILVLRADGDTYAFLRVEVPAIPSMDAKFTIDIKEVRLCGPTE